MLIIVSYSFLAGLVTILAPCIWPLLPIIFSSSVSGGYRKPFGIAVGVIVTFGLLTLTISYIVKVIPFDPGLLRIFSFIVISFSGLLLIFPYLAGKIEVMVGRVTSRAAVKKDSSSGLFSGLLVGMSLGIVWTPCAGPILATIAALGATQKVNFSTVIVTVTYLIGVGIPLFIFASFGTQLLNRVKHTAASTRRIQVIFGSIMIATSILIITNYDKVLEAKLLDLFPAYYNHLISLESNPGVQKNLEILKGNDNQNAVLNNSSNQIINSGMPVLGKAPDFTGITKWLNTDKPLSIGDLKGKVVLVDFWTYTCINCLRTLPFLTDWYDKYKDKGFAVIGVHTPEFEFEKNTDNVIEAINRYKIHYPVAQDNNYATWNNYHNQYWPAEYLIDGYGNIRKMHFGEGEYDRTEDAIQKLLAESGNKTDKTLISLPDQTPKNRLSPETYLGSQRMEYYYPSERLTTGVRIFPSSEKPVQGTFSLSGEWEIADEYTITRQKSVLNLNYFADKVFLVLRPGVSGNQAKVKVILDGHTVDNNNAGSDVNDGIVSLDNDRLYNLIDSKGNPGSHLLEIEFLNKGIEAYAFTFG